MNVFSVFLIKIKHSLLAAFLLLSGLIGHSNFALAELVCNPVPSVPVINTLVTISQYSYAGNDLPIGSIIYQSNIRSNRPSGHIRCVGDFSDTLVFPVSIYIEDTPLLPAVSMPVPGFGNMLVYPTNVSGVGVALGRTGSSLSPTQPIRLGTNSIGGGTSSSIIVDWTEFSASVVLVKTGQIASGASVDANIFPTIKVIMDAPFNTRISGSVQFPFKIWSASFTGSVNFTTSTCRTPDLHVNMGSYGLTSFQGIGGFSPWVDASILLQECPVFSGRNTSDTAQRFIDTGTAAGSNTTPTLLSVSLTPASSIIDTANGVIEVDAAGSTGAAATGVGLQLGYTPNNINATATSPLNIWMPGMSWDVQPPNDGSDSFKIPLAARYYQTSNTVTAGPANARVTFNIDYK